VEDAEVDGRVDVGGEVGEEMAVQIDVRFARTGDVEGRSCGQSRDVEVRAKKVWVGAELSLIRGEAAAISAEGGYVACGPELLLGQRGVEWLGRGDGVACGVKATVGEGGLRGEAGDGEEDDGRQERSLNSHGE
jgi:hypothetical protein